VRRVVLTPSLWAGPAGNLLQTWSDLSLLLVQPSLESVLNETLGLDDTTPLELLDRRWPNLATVLVSHTVTALLLSPVQVLRTRYPPPPPHTPPRAPRAITHTPDRGAAG
jgi:hypothetical protein